MKTRSEIAQELADEQAKSNITEEAQELKSFLREFLVDLRASKINHDHSYKLSDEVPLKQLKIAVENIPNEFTQKVVHSTDSVSHKFLWFYFIISSLVMAACLAFGFTQYQESEKREKFEKEIYHDGRIMGREEVFKILPKNSQKFLLKKYPNTFESFVERRAE